MLKNRCFCKAIVYWDFQKFSVDFEYEGKSHFIARIPRLSRDQLKVKQLEEEKLNNEYKVKLFKLEMEELKTKFKKLEEQQMDREENLVKLSKLYEMGVIDENGELVNNKME